MVRDRVVVCARDPEVAVMVTVDVPVGTGFGLVVLLVPLHPERNTRANRSDSAPPPINRDLRNFFRFQITGMIAENPIGTKAPSATNSPVGLRCRRDVEYGFGGGVV
jgi:hypothetical protein